MGTNKEFFYASYFSYFTYNTNCDDDYGESCSMDDSKKVIRYDGSDIFFHVFLCDGKLNSILDWNAA